MRVTRRHCRFSKRALCWAASAAVAVSLLAIGCSQRTEKIESPYGGRRGSGAKSVNGISVLARMFQSAGHRVVSRATGTDLEDCQVVIWAPDRFTPPTISERNVIEEWLYGDERRTFVYIGRDYDASIDYWESVAASAAPKDVEEAQRRLALARSVHDTARTAIPKEENVHWFVVRRDEPRQRVDRFAGPWAEEIDAQAVNIQLQARFDVPTPSDPDPDTQYVDGVEVESLIDQWRESFSGSELEHETLLSMPAEGETDDDPFNEEGGIRPVDNPLVMRVTHSNWRDNQLIVVTNGSFLLNLPLVNHQHRRLAGRLIRECGEPGRVMFWEAGRFDPSSRPQDRWSVLTTWPLNFILLHLAVLGMLYLLWQFPIFGTARRLRPAATSDFAKHIDALGELMSAGGDASYARRRLEEYHQRVRHEHGDAKPSTPKAAVRRAK